MTVKELQELQKKYKIPEISVDFLDDAYIRVQSKQMDTARHLLITVTENGEKKVFTESQKIAVRMKKPDGNSVYNAGVFIEDGRILVELTEQMLAVPGCADMELSFADSKTAKIYSTKIIHLDIAPQVYPNDEIISSYEFDALNKQIEHLIDVENTVNTNEEIRKTNESIRQDNEESRKRSELSRIESEDERITNENNRKNAETNRVNDENIRKSNEDTRISNENTRKSNEQNRQNNETARNNAENIRVTNENNRSANEQSRVAAENIRQANENTRQNQESNRQNNTATAISNAEKASEKANDAANNLQNKLDSHYFVLTDDKDVANGVPSLDANKKVPIDELYDASTSSKGIVQLANSASNSTTTAATPNLVQSTESNHNLSATAHNDIRNLIKELTNRLNALADSDDTTLDQLSEIVSYIKSNRSLIENVTTNKVNVTDIIDNLTTTATNKPLSANQGKQLKGLIESLTNVVDNITPDDIGALPIRGGVVTGRTNFNQGTSVIRLSGGKGTSGYAYICQIKITADYVNQPIILKVLQRENMGELIIKFSNISGRDPEIDWFVKRGRITAYIAKSATSTWDVYLAKSEAYDDIEIVQLDIGAYNRGGIAIEWKDATVTALPSGYITATLDDYTVNIRGNADTATKLATARQISLSGAVTGNVNFDGSGNVDITTTRRSATILKETNANDVWYKFATSTTSSPYVDRSITFLVSAGYGDASLRVGILTAHFRTSSTGNVETCEIVWNLANQNINPSNFVLAYNGSNVPAQVELWAKLDGNYATLLFEVLIEKSRGTTGEQFTLYKVTGSGGGNPAITSGYTQKVSYLGRIRNTADEAIKATQDEDGNNIKATYLKKSGDTSLQLSGNIIFDNISSGSRGINGTVGDNDYWRVFGGATATNTGYLEFATADDGTEPIYVRQYSGNGTTVFGSVKRELALLDGAGNTKIPGIIYPSSRTQTIGLVDAPWSTGYFNGLYSNSIVSFSNSNYYNMLAFNTSISVAYTSAGSTKYDKAVSVGSLSISSIISGENINLNSNNIIFANKYIYTPSDEKIKTFTDDIGNDKDTLIKLFDLIQLKSYRYRYSGSDNESLTIGLSAQELESACEELGINPEKYNLLHINYDYMLPRGDSEEDYKYYTKFYSISYNDLYNLSLLKIKSIEEEHYKEINDLKEKYNNLEERLSALEGGLIQ